MKNILIAILLFRSCLARADVNQNDCTENLLGKKDWAEISIAVLTCLDASSDFVTGIGVLGYWGIV